MLEGNLSNQDEDDVEEELEALQREVAGPQVAPKLPNAPTNALPTPEEVETPEEPRAKAKTRTAALAA